MSQHHYPEVIVMCLLVKGLLPIAIGMVKVSIIKYDCGLNDMKHNMLQRIKTRSHKTNGFFCAKIFFKTRQGFLANSGWAN